MTTQVKKHKGLQLSGSTSVFRFCSAPESCNKFLHYNSFNKPTLPATQHKITREESARTPQSGLQGSSGCASECIRSREALCPCSTEQKTGLGTKQPPETQQNRVLGLVGTCMLKSSQYLNLLCSGTKKNEIK